MTHPSSEEMRSPVFELNALVISANTVFVLHEDPAILVRARTAMERALAAATPA